MRRLIVYGLALEALTLAGLALHHRGAITLPSLRLTWVFVGFATLAGAVYLLAVRDVLRASLPRSGIWLVLGIALLLRLTVLFAPPFLSSDVFRYVWDGKVQAAGINPYRYVPADPALTALRDTAIYPHINRADYARTIYPPAAQLVFALAARISPSVLAMKATMVAFEAAGVLAIVAVLGLIGLPQARVLIYAWNPLTVWAFAGNGHVDALAIGCLGLAILARARRRDTLTGALLGAAALTKFLPAAMAPALWRRGDWRMPLAAIAVIVALYLGYYLGAGSHILGFLPHYANEEGIDRGSGFWLLAGIGHLFRIGPALRLGYEAACAVLLLGLAAWVAARPREEQLADDITRVCRDAAMLAAVTMVVVSPHYSWYFAWLALPCCVFPLRSVIYLSVAGLLLDLNPWNEHFFWASLLYVPAALLALLDIQQINATSRRRRLRRRV